MAVTRRTCLKGLAAQALVTPLAISSEISGTIAGPGTTPMHEKIADHVRQNRSAQNLRLLIPEGSEHNLWPIAQQFNQLTGVDCSFDIVSVDDINTQILLDNQLEQVDYDLALPATFGIPDLAQADALADNSDLQQQFEPTDFNLSTAHTAGQRFNGRFYGYHCDGDAYLMFYNRTLNDKQTLEEFSDTFGYQYRTPRTWEELDAHMAFYHRPALDQFGGALFRSSNYLVWEFWARLHAKGKLPFADDLTPTINSDAGITALEELLRASQYQVPEAFSAGLVENWQMYAQGNIYANIGWGGTQKYLYSNNANLAQALGHSSLPKGMIDNQYISCDYFNWGWTFAVMRDTPHRVLAYLFSLFATSPIPSTAAVGESRGFFDPFREEHYQDPNIISLYGNNFLQAHKTAMRNAIPDLYISGQNIYMGELRKYIIMALQGRMTAKQALDIAAQSWENTHSRLGYAQQQRQWLELKAQYPAPFRNTPS